MDINTKWTALLLLLRRRVTNITYSLTHDLSAVSVVAVAVVVAVAYESRVSFSEELYSPSVAMKDDLLSWEAMALLMTSSHFFAPTTESDMWYALPDRLHSMSNSLLLFYKESKLRPQRQ